tara:strand:- start:48 stop:482 length:435 start_codon:yes stop_codon:yes gene_type:complete
MPYIQKGFTPFTNVNDVVQGVKDKLTPQGGGGSVIKDAVSKVVDKKNAIKEKAKALTNTKVGKVASFGAKVGRDQLIQTGAKKGLTKLGLKAAGRAVPFVGAAITAVDAYKFLDKYKHMPKQNLTRDAKIQQKFGGSYTMGPGK